MAEVSHLEQGTEISLYSLFVRKCGYGCVLNTDPRQVADGHLLIVGTPGVSTRRKVAQLDYRHVPSGTLDRRSDVES